MKNGLLPHINDPADLRDLSTDQLIELTSELRNFIIRMVATKEGHLGASLGVIELTIALHYVFNTPDDQLVWDVGHQAYGHKILTGRRDLFHTNRQKDGISGFPKRDESPYDTFGTGHSSTAISAALGMAMAAQLSGNRDRQHIAVVGDASIASGMAFEAMNHAGVTGANLLIILNDNAIGIDPSVGALKNYLAQTAPGKPGGASALFNAFNLNYSGPVDGHDLPSLIEELNRLAKVDGPRLLHVVTTKGKGLKKAEEDQVRYHAPGKFDAETGEILRKETGPLPPKFQDVFGKTLVELAGVNPKIVGITPAMPTGSSLKLMMEAFPERAFDVGIAEQHAVTLAAGMATQGYRVFCNIYSTFLQRAYDQVIHDVCLQNLPVVFCLDRAGLVGEDGGTHHGIFDLVYLRGIPNLTIMAPRNAIELRNALYTAQLSIDGPWAIRYPRGRDELIKWEMDFEALPRAKGQMLRDGKKMAILSLGTTAYQAAEAIELSGQDIAHYDMRFLKPLDTDLLTEIFDQYQTLITVEDGVIQGGFGSAILEEASKQEYTGKIIRLGIGDYFPQHASVGQLKEEAGITTQAITDIILSHQ